MPRISKDWSRASRVPISEGSGRSSKRQPIFEQDVAGGIGAELQADRRFLDRKRPPVIGAGVPGWYGPEVVHLVQPRPIRCRRAWTYYVSR